MFSILKSKKSTILFEWQSSFWAGSVVNMLQFFLTGTSVLCPEEAQRMRVRDIGRQMFREKKVTSFAVRSRAIMFIYFSHCRISAAIFDLVCKIKCRSTQQILSVFPFIFKRSWVCRFWGRRYFSTTNGAITEDIVFRC